MRIKMKLILGMTFLAILALSATAEDTSETPHQKGGKRARRIVDEIKRQNFEEAAKVIGKIKNDLQGTMNFVIHELYNNKAGSFETVMRLVAANNNVTSNFAIFKALNYEMTINEDNSYLRRLRLVKSYNEKVVDQTGESASDDQNALKDELYNSAGNVAGGEMMEALKTNNSAKVTEISDNVHENYPALFEKVIARALADGFDEINGQYLVDLFRKHKRPSQSVFAYSNLYYQLYKHKRTAQPLVVTLGFALKEAMARGLDRAADAKADILKNTLPASVRNIVFGTRLCIASAKRRRYPNNIVKDEYLYASSDTYDNENLRRLVYTWVKGGKVDNGHWYVEKSKYNEDRYFLKNVYYNRKMKTYRTEYLYSAWKNHWYAERRHVFTYVPGPPDDEQFDWVFVPSGDNVAIKSTKFNEYLSVTDDIDRFDVVRPVFTGKLAGANSLWRVESC